MKYSTSQYAKIFSSLMEKVPKGHRENAIKDFAKMIEQNGDLKNTSEIFNVIETDLYEKEGKVKTETLVAKDHPELIGGIKIKMGDTLIDNSIQSRIKNLKSALTA